MSSNDWITSRLGDLFEFKNGFNASKDQYGSGVKFINVSEIFKNEEIRSEHIPGQVNVNEEQLSLYRVQRGDVLFNRTSETFDEIAMSAVYLDDEDVIFGGFVIRGRPLTNALVPEYCKYAFQVEEVRKEIIRRGQGAVRANIGQNDLSKVLLKYPTQEVQRKIVKILSEWDSAIALKEKEILAKKLRKKGYVQKIFTNDVSDKKWEEIKLEDVCTFKGGSGFKVEYQGKTTGVHPFIKVSDFNLPGNEKYILNSNNWISEEDLKQLKAFLFPVNTVCFAKVGAALLLNRRRLLTMSTAMDNNTMGAIPNPEKCDPEFLYQFFLTLDFGDYVQEGALPSINQSTLGSIRTKFPAISEQKKIGLFLHTLDEELFCLSLHRKLLKKQRQGLMQQLLTGKKVVSS